MDAGDIIRKRQTIAVFNGYKQTQTIEQPSINISTCAGFYGQSTIHSFKTYENLQNVVVGLSNCLACNCS